MNQPTVAKIEKKERRYPKFETVISGIWNSITTIDHPFLQKLIDSKAMMILMGGEFTVYAGDLVGVLLCVHDDAIHIECISTTKDNRNKGEATKVMQCLIAISKETKIPITLRTANVTGNGWNMMQHPVVMMGMEKKGKIPSGSLHKWYEKLGFQKVEKVKNGYSMIFKP
jgi:ribosomal protein S18 acetylase RimI-like enzyme